MLYIYFMKNYKAKYRNACSFDISKTSEEVGEYQGDTCDYIVVKTLGEAKKYLRRLIKAEREELSSALWSIDNVFTKEKLS